MRTPFTALKCKQRKYLNVSMVDISILFFLFKSDFYILHLSQYFNQIHTFIKITFLVFIKITCSWFLLYFCKFRHPSPQRSHTQHKKKATVAPNVCVTDRDHHCLHLCTCLALLIQSRTADLQQETCRGEEKGRCLNMSGPYSHGNTCCTFQST